MTDTVGILRCRIESILLDVNNHETTGLGVMATRKKPRIQMIDSCVNTRRIVGSRRPLADDQNIEGLLFMIIRFPAPAPKAKARKGGGGQSFSADDFCRSFFQALGAHAVGKFGFRMLFDVGLDSLPVPFIGADLLARGANRQETAQRLDMRQGIPELGDQFMNPVFAFFPLGGFVQR
jgi:hypothetical protein